MAVLEILKSVQTQSLLNQTDYLNWPISDTNHQNDVASVLAANN